MWVTIQGCSLKKATQTRQHRQTTSGLMTNLMRSSSKTMLTQLITIHNLRRLSPQNLVVVIWASSITAGMVTANNTSMITTIITIITIIIKRADTSYTIITQWQIKTVQGKAVLFPLVAPLSHTPTLITISITTTITITTTMDKVTMVVVTIKATSRETIRTIRGNSSSSNRIAIS